MIKTILVPVGAADTDDPQFAAAVWAARLFASHIDFLYARLEPAEAATQAAAFLGGAVVSPEMLERLESAAARRETEAFDAYRNFCKQQQIAVDGAPAGPGAVTATWHRETGYAAEWVTTYGRTSDLLVARHFISNVPATSAVLQAALFDTGRPVLIPGTAPPALDTVALAWKPTRETARAVAAAMPFLTRAKRIAVLAASNEGAIDRDSCERLVQSLRRQCPLVDASYLDIGSRDVGEALLAAARQVGAGLLVMGAYGRGRLRELVFGGVTERMLRGSDVPVLMAH